MLDTGFAFFDLKSDLIKSIVTEWLDPQAYRRLLTVLRTTHGLAPWEQHELMQLQLGKKLALVASGDQKDLLFQQELAMLFLVLPEELRKDLRASNTDTKLALAQCMRSSDAEPKHRLIIGNFIRMIETGIAPDFDQADMSNIMDQLIQGDIGLQAALLGYIHFFSAEQWDEFADKMIYALRHGTPSNEEDSDNETASSDDEEASLDSEEVSLDGEEVVLFADASVLSQAISLDQAIDVCKVTLPFIPNREKIFDLLSALLDIMIKSPTDDTYESIYYVFDNASPYLNQEERKKLIDDKKDALLSLSIEEDTTIEYLHPIILKYAPSALKEQLDKIFEEIRASLLDKQYKPSQRIMDSVSQHPSFRDTLLKHELFAYIVGQINYLPNPDKDFLEFALYLIDLIKMNFTNSDINPQILVKRMVYLLGQQWDHERRDEIRKITLKVFVRFIQELPDDSSRINLLTTVTALKVLIEKEHTITPEDNYWQAAFEAIKASTSNGAHEHLDRLATLSTNNLKTDNPAKRDFPNGYQQSINLFLDVIAFTAGISKHEFEKITDISKFEKIIDRQQRHILTGDHDVVIASIQWLTNFAAVQEVFLKSKFLSFLLDNISDEGTCRIATKIIFLVTGGMKKEFVKTNNLAEKLLNYVKKLIPSIEKFALDSNSIYQLSVIILNLLKCFSGKEQGELLHLLYESTPNCLSRLMDEPMTQVPLCKAFYSAAVKNPFENHERENLVNRSLTAIKEKMLQPNQRHFSPDLVGLGLLAHCSESFFVSGNFFEELWDILSAIADHKKADVLAILGRCAGFFAVQKPEQFRRFFSKIEDSHLNASSPEESKMLLNALELAMSVIEWDSSENFSKFLGQHPLLNRLVSLLEQETRYFMRLNILYTLQSLASLKSNYFNESMKENAKLIERLLLTLNMPKQPPPSGCYYLDRFKEDNCAGIAMNLLTRWIAQGEDFRQHEHYHADTAWGMIFETMYENNKYLPEQPLLAQVPTSKMR